MNGDSLVVLIVDDSTTIRFIFKNNLEKIAGVKLEVIEANDGKSALGMLQSRSDISLLITDLQMPNMSGMDLIREMRKISKYTWMPVIVISATLDAELKQQLRSLKVNMAVHKPFTKSEFDSIVVPTIVSLGSKGQAVTIDKEEFMSSFAQHGARLSFANDEVVVESGELVLNCNISDFLSISKAKYKLYDMMDGENIT